MYLSLLLLCFQYIRLYFDTDSLLQHKVSVLEGVVEYLFALTDLDTDVESMDIGSMRQFCDAAFKFASDGLVPLS